MIVDAHVHIGKSTRLQIDANGDMLVRIADELGLDRICCTDLTALFYDMHEGNRLLGIRIAFSATQACTPRGSGKRRWMNWTAVSANTECAG